MYIYIYYVCTMLTFTFIMYQIVLTQTWIFFNFPSYEFPHIRVFSLFPIHL